MAKPPKPTVPAPPLRSAPSTFSSLAEAFLNFFPTFATYLDEVGDFTSAQADAALAAALGGTLPSPTGHGGKFIRVKPDETGVEFASVYATTATAAGTTTLTVNSSDGQFFTGTTTQTVVLPVVSTLVLGRRIEITNNSTGAITVNSSGGNLVGTVPANTVMSFTCILLTGTTAASWDAKVEALQAVPATTASPSFTGQVSVPLGSAAAPSIIPTGDPNTGIFSPGADLLAITTGGVERMRLNASGAIGLGGGNYGEAGQIVTSAGLGAPPVWSTPQSGWVPYNLPSDGLIYDFTANGAVASIETPTFTDGYEYLIMAEGFGKGVSGSALTFQIELYRNQAAAYAGAAAFFATAGTAALSVTGFASIALPRRAIRTHYIIGHMATDTTNATTGGGLFYNTINHTTATKIDKARISWSTSALTTSGKLYLYRRLLP